MEMSAQQLSAFVTERAAMLLHLFEDAHQIAAISRKNLRFGDRDVVSGDPYSLPYISPQADHPADKRPAIIGQAMRDQGSEAADF